MATSIKATPNNSDWTSDIKDYRETMNLTNNISYLEVDQKFRR